MGSLWGRLGGFWWFLGPLESEASGWSLFGKVSGRVFGGLWSVWGPLEHVPLGTSTGPLNKVVTLNLVLEVVFWSKTLLQQGTRRGVQRPWPEQFRGPRNLIPKHPQKAGGPRGHQSPRKPDRPQNF